MDAKKYTNLLLKIAHKSPQHDASRVLDNFMDYLIDTFDLPNLQKFALNYEQVFLYAKQRNEDFFELMTAWFVEVDKEMQNGRTLDFFGTMYEETWKSKGKASALGQFFTPEHICRLMADITSEKESGRYNDPACGSGRTMLAAFEKADQSKFNYFDAGDIDSTSCKMCALNFMVHGMIGEVKQQNALTLDTPFVIYKINEVRYPFPTNMYSIRRIYPSQKKKAEKPKTEVLTPKEEKKEEPKPKTPTKPIELSLF